MSLTANPNRENIVAALLEMTGINFPPTKPEIMVKELGLKVVSFDNHKEYDLPSNVRAFLFVEPAKTPIIGVHRKLMRVQTRFSILHEIGHFVLPGHLETQHSFEDTVSTFRAHLRALGDVAALEIEANQFAADCLFQLGHFDNHISITQLSWDNVISAADMYVASIEATARRWVERSKEDCALIVFKPSPPKRNLPQPRVETMYTITSKTFEKSYFSRIESEQAMDEDSIVHQIFYNSREIGSFAEGTLMVSGTLRFNMQLFNNHYRVLGLLTPV